MPKLCEEQGKGRLRASIEKLQFQIGEFKSYFNFFENKEEADNDNSKSEMWKIITNSGSHCISLEVSKPRA